LGSADRHFASLFGGNAESDDLPTCFGMARDESEEERKAKRQKHSHDEHHGKRQLPHGARKLSKDDFEGYKGVFRRYLRDKKDIRMEDIPSSEAYARFKSFVHKWYASVRYALIQE